MNKFGIRKRLTLTITSIVVLTVMIVSAIAGYLEIKNYRDQKQQTVTANLDACKNHMDSWLNEKITMSAVMTMEASSESFAKNRADGLAFLQDCLKMDSELSDCYIGFADGTGIFAGGWTPTSDEYDPTTREWYQDACNNSGYIITAPYTDVQTGKIVVTIANKIESNGNIVGVMAIDMYLETIESFVDSLHIDENGYALLTLSDSSVIVHENKAFLPTIGTDGNTVFTKLADAAQGYSAGSAASSLQSIEDYNGETAEYGETVLDTTGWKLGYMLNYSEYNSMLVKINVRFFIVIVASGILMALLATLLLKRAFSPLIDIAVKSKAVATGNLDVTFSYKGNDEIGKLCRTIENNNASIRKYINDIEYRLEGIALGEFERISDTEYIGDYLSIKKSLDKISHDLSELFMGIELASNDVSIGASEVSNSSSDLAEAVSHQTELIQGIVHGIGSVSEKVEDNVSGTDDAKNTALQTVSVVNTGSKLMQKLVQAMNEISQSSEEIKNIIKTIEDISFQTNILALNASVEASRAGEAGKGFAVVADEVRNLATKSSKASEQTTQLIERSVNAVVNGRAIADETFESLHHIVEHTENIGKIIANINEDSHEQRNLINEINEKVKLVSDYAMSAAASAEESAASAEELNGQAATLGDIIQNYRK